ncbi:hypothetical protein SAT01_38290 [Sinomonas atrocyanea]|nr:hypothetical protein SAT01_38290 [Sinomonas atrocyanea]GGG71942.1 hypothetical protein GCM10007172_25390 [Sinomonas atrocyanea]
MRVVEATTSRASTGVSDSSRSIVVLLLAGRSSPVHLCCSYPDGRREHAPVCALSPYWASRTAPSLGSMDPLLPSRGPSGRVAPWERQRG